MTNPIIAVDIGGTNIRVALLNASLEIIKKEKVLTKDCETIREFLEMLKGMIAKVDEKKEAREVGIVIPAPWTREQKIIADVTVRYLEGVSIDEIKTFLPDYEIYFENDVNVIALLEADCGAAKNTEHSIYITISTGIGSGIIINNQIYHGAHGYAGEIGSIIISDKHISEAEPLKGSLEETCSGKALEVESKHFYGEDATTRQLFVKCEEGDKQAEKALDEWIEHLTQGLAGVIQTLDPDVVVLGGSVVLNHRWIIEKIEKGISQKVLGELSKKTKVVTAKYGNDAGIIGAAYYAQKRAKGE